MSHKIVTKGSVPARQDELPGKGWMEDPTTAIRGLAFQFPLVCRDRTLDVGCAAPPRCPYLPQLAAPRLQSYRPSLSRPCPARNHRRGGSAATNGPVAGPRSRCLVRSLGYPTRWGREQPACGVRKG